MKSLGVCYWYVIIPQCRYMGAWVRIYYVLCSKIYHMAPFAVCLSPTGTQWATRGAHICEICLLNEWVIDFNSLSLTSRSICNSFTKENSFTKNFQFLSYTEVTAATIDKSTDTGASGAAGLTNTIPSLYPLHTSEFPKEWILQDSNLLLHYLEAFYQHLWVWPLGTSIITSPSAAARAGSISPYHQRKSLCNVASSQMYITWRRVWCW